jgi:hypothetical protein
MKKTLTTSFLIFLIFFSSCKKNIQVNDDFRDKVVSKLKVQKDTLKAFNILLDKLDRKNVSFGEYYKKSCYQIQDSCDNVMYQKFKIDPVYDNITPEMYDFLHTITKTALDKYDAKFKIHQDTSKIGIYITALNPEVKKYLNKNYNLDLNIE